MLRVEKFPNRIALKLVMRHMVTMAPRLASQFQCEELEKFDRCLVKSIAFRSSCHVGTRRAHLQIDFSIRISFDNGRSEQLEQAPRGLYGKSDTKRRYQHA